MKDETPGKEKKVISNPYFTKLNRLVEVAVRHETYKVYSDIGEMNGVEPEVIMNRCLEDYARILQEDDDVEVIYQVPKELNNRNSSHVS